MRRALWTAATLGTLPAAGAHAEDAAISPAVKGKDGILVHAVRSPYQAGETKIRVLLPDRLDKDVKHPVLYVLPVEALDRDRYGDGLSEVKRRGLHNKHGLICVAPTFSHLPWYADHPTDKTIRQETHLLRVVVPFIERAYPAIAKPEGRLLVGFSKSGWGAFTLLLRHPDVFGKAAAWDAPLMKEEPNQFGMGPIFGSQKNFEKYRVTALLEQRAKALQQANRLVLTGYGSFRGHHRKAHQRMKDLGIRHAYRDGPRRKHHWEGGWLEEAVSLLARKPQ